MVVEDLLISSRRSQPFNWCALKKHYYYSITSTTCGKGSWMRMDPDVGFSTLNLFSLDTCCLNLKVIFLVVTFEGKKRQLSEFLVIFGSLFFSFMVNFKTNLKHFRHFKNLIHLQCCDFSLKNMIKLYELEQMAF